VSIVLTKSAIVPLKNEIAAPYNEKRVDAAKAGLDLPFKPRQRRATLSATCGC
jgi:hypothetical protein